MNSAQTYIDTLKLTPHPEGGYFREIYRAEGIISQPNLPFRYSGGRSYSTAIYYLLSSGEVSSLHRLASDEQWFHIDGSALTIHSIAPDGAYTAHRIGKDLAGGELPFAIVPHGCWFGGSVDKTDSFALVGCVVAPGFDFNDFELAERETLVSRFPQHRDIIQQLTRK